MELVSMKIKAKSTDAEPIKEESRELWPYGLRLHFNNDQFDLLPVLKTLSVGDKVSIVAEAEVVSFDKIERLEKGKPKENLDLVMQIQGIDIAQNKPLSKMSMKEYRIARERSKR